MTWMAIVVTDRCGTAGRFTTVTAPPARSRRERAPHKDRF